MKNILNDAEKSQKKATYKQQDNNRKSTYQALLDRKSRLKI